MTQFKTKHVGEWVCLATILAIASAGLRAHAQPAGGAPISDADWRKQVDARMQQLEKENADLRQRLGTVADTQQAVMKEAQSRGFLTLEAGVPRLTTPDFFDVNKYVSEGDFPGSVRLAGTKTSFQIGGYVQLDAIFYTHRIGNKNTFVVSSIPTRGGAPRAGGRHHP